MLFSVLGVRNPRAKVFVAKLGFIQALAVVILSSACLAVGVSIPGSCGSSFCSMAVSVSGVYRLAAEELREKCAEWKLDSSSPVRSLRRRV